jgi:GT2 family glycosyltransferase
MSLLGFGYDRDFGQQFEPAAPDEPPRDVLFPTAAAMLMRKSDFAECGGFDPAMFMYHEDVDLGWRLWLFGKRVVLCPRSIVRHYRSATTALTHSERWKAEVGLRHSVRATLKNYEWRTARPVLRRLLAHYRQHGHLDVIIHVAQWNLRHLRSTLRARREVQARRRISDAELFGRGLIDSAILRRRLCCR